jgi:hypothetical protein
MSDEPVLSLRQLEEEEARLKSRLAMIAAAKQLFLESTAVSGAWKPAAYNNSAPPDSAPTTPVAAAEPDVAASAFDRTFGELIDAYQVHEKSPVHELKHSVRLNYLRSLKRLKKDIGGERISGWTAGNVQGLFDRFASEGKVSMGHEMLGKIRLLCSFGATQLDDGYCIRLSTLIGMMRFPPVEGGGSQRLTREQARAIRITAREHFGWDSIALAVALQFDVPKLKQMDIIGEWVPMDDPAKSEIIKGSEKWIRGLRWSDLDVNMVLHRAIIEGRRKKGAEYRLSRSQMAMEEINRVSPAKRTGPMIICEFSGVPWSGNEFRRKLKIVAEKAGVTLGTRSETGDDDTTSEGVFA